MILNILLLCFGLFAKITLQAPLNYRHEKRGDSFISPVFTKPSLFDAGLINSMTESPPNSLGNNGFDGGSDPEGGKKAIVFPKAIPSAPWPYGRGLEPVWEGPNYWLDRSPEWSIREEVLVTPPPTPFPKPVKGQGAWAPLGAVGDAVDAMIARGASAAVPATATIPPTATIAAPPADTPAVAPPAPHVEIFGGVCPHCGRGPSAWDKVVGWFKGLGRG